MTQLMRLFLIVVVWQATGCSKCDEVTPTAWPLARLRLLGANNQDLWFGSMATFDPDSLRVYKPGTQGLVAVDVIVNRNANTPHVAVALEPRDAISTYYFQFKAQDTDTIAYFVLIEEVNCQESYQIGRMEQNGTLICNYCGVPADQGGPGEFALLRKN
jgi:hypothetical protein